jgi:hypothetical protein
MLILPPTPHLCQPAQDDFFATICKAQTRSPELAAAIVQMAYAANSFIGHLHFAIPLGRFLRGVRLILGADDAAMMDETRINGSLPKFDRIGEVDLHNEQVTVGVTVQRDAKHDLITRVVTLVYANKASGLAAAVTRPFHDPITMDHMLVRRALRRAAVLSPFHLAQRA